MRLCQTRFCSCRSVPTSEATACWSDSLKSPELHVALVQVGSFSATTHRHCRQGCVLGPLFRNLSISKILWHKGTPALVSVSCSACLADAMACVCACRIVMVGGGYIACEQASIYNALGSEVHFLIRGVSVTLAWPPHFMHALPQGHSILY